jgi:hypothetical protein
MLSGSQSLENAVQELLQFDVRALWSGVFGFRLFDDLPDIGAITLSDSQAISDQVKLF